MKLGLVVNTGRLLFDLVLCFGFYFFQCSVSFKLDFD